MNLTELTNTQLWATLEGVGQMMDDTSLPNEEDEKEMDTLWDAVFLELATRTGTTVEELKDNEKYVQWWKEHSPFSEENGCIYR